MKKQQKQHYHREIIRSVAYGMAFLFAIALFAMSLIQITPIQYQATYVSYVCTRGECNIDFSKALIEVTDGRYEFNSENIEIFKNALYENGVVEDYTSAKIVLRFNGPLSHKDAGRVIKNALDSLTYVGWAKDHEQRNQSIPPYVYIW